MSGELTCRLISAKSSREWADAIGVNSAATSFTAAYHLMAERIWGGEAYLAVVERAGNRLVWPYISRPIPGADDLTDICSAYGFGGPLVVTDSVDDAGFAADALNHLMQRWRSMGVVSSFTRFCPFHENHKPLQTWLERNRQAGGSIELTGHVVVFDLKQTPEQRWSGIRRSVQKEIKKAQNFGLQGDHDPNWDGLDDFLAIYQSVGERNELEARHLLSRQDFLTMRECLGANAVLFHVKHNEKIAGSAICVISGRVMHGMFAGPHPDYLRLGAYKLLMRFQADWCAQHGLDYMNLGGGRGGRDTDNLYQFKRGFSQVELPFYTGRLIVDGSAYFELAQKAASRFGKQPPQQASFFPAYRARELCGEDKTELAPNHEVLSGVKACLKR